MDVLNHGRDQLGYKRILKQKVWMLDEIEWLISEEKKCKRGR